MYTQERYEPVWQFFELKKENINKKKIVTVNIFDDPVRRGNVKEVRKKYSEIKKKEKWF